MILLHRIGIGLGEKCQTKHLLGREEKLNHKMIVSDGDRVSVMASDEFDEAEDEAQPQEDYSSRVFNLSMSIKTSGNLMMPMSIMCIDTFRRCSQIL